MAAGQAALVIALAALVDRTHRRAIIGGGALAVALMYLQYTHAKRAGLRNGGPPTESYGAKGWGS